MKTTRAALLTPHGQGAVASVGIWGERALSCVAACFQPASRTPLEELANRRVVFGHWRSSGEELVVCCFSAHHAEVHCHGGTAPSRAVLNDLIAQGCQPCAASDGLARLSPLRRAAAETLSFAPTRRTAAILLDQMHGALERELCEIMTQLEAAAESAAEARLEALLSRAECGTHLVQPWRLAIVGQPNVGKSSLLNTLVGFERAIVFDQPGTTRDVLTIHASIDGWPVCFADTAGIRQATDAIEREGVRRAGGEIANADLRILVSDRSQPWTSADEHICSGAISAQSPTHQSWIVVHNKSDLPLAAGERFPGINVSCQTESRISELIELISLRLVPQPPQPGAAVPFSIAIRDSLQAALEACRDRRPMDARHMLQSLVAG